MFYQKGGIVDLREYLFRNRLSQRKFSQVTGISAPTIHKICQTKHKPSQAIVNLISKYTDDKVSFSNSPIKPDGRKRIRKKEELIKEPESSAQITIRNSDQDLFETRSLLDCTFCPHCQKAIYN
jgi:transcriptional regulator with XRE-family HTH domain